MSENNNNRLDKLSEIYYDIWKWGQGYEMDVALRKTEAIDPYSQIFIIGEAYARNQVHQTGINWFNKLGKIGPAGQNLEKILNFVEYSIRPPRRVSVGNYWVEPNTKQYQTAYTTDICPCFPGRNSLPRMIKDALSHEFLVRELEALRPKVILLLGKRSYKAFFKHILKQEMNLKISESFVKLSPQTVNQLNEYMGAIVVPFYHPSPQNAHLTSWLAKKTPLSDRPQIQALRMIVNS